MDLLTIVRVVTVVSTGLLAGIFLGYLASAPARGALSASSFVQHQQVVHVYYARIAPALIVAAVLAGLTWLWLVRSQWRGAEFWLTAAAAGGIVSITVLTRAVNAPLNDQLMTWIIAAPPANVRELWAPWEFSHMVRTVVAVVAFVLAVVAMGIGTDGKTDRPSRKGGLTAGIGLTIQHAFYLQRLFRAASGLNPMTSISPLLTRLPAKLSGEWVRRWNRNLWEGTVSCREQFVILLLGQRHTELLWAKSLPSKNNTLELKLELFPISNTEPNFQLLFSSGTGAFIQGATAELPQREHTPSIKTPETFDTGFVQPFARVDAVKTLDFSFVCIAKGDVVVRRGYVWGLKPRFLGDLESPWDEILARGRNGVASLKAAA